MRKEALIIEGACKGKHNVKSPFRSILRLEFKDCGVKSHGRPVTQGFGRIGACISNIR